MNIAFRIVANKKVKMTDDEFQVYNNIIETYAEFGGDSVFHDLFETNSDGLIVMVKPPSARKVPIEAYLFVLSLQQQQVLRRLEDVVILFLEDMKQKYDNSR